MRKLLIINDEFLALVEDYAAERGIKSVNAALLELAAVGLKQETGREVAQPAPEWGGRRVPDEPPKN